MALLLPDLLLLEVDDLVLHLARRRMHHLNGIIDLWHTVDVKGLLLLGYHIVYVFFSTQLLQDLIVDTECLDSFIGIIDAEVGPLLLLENHVGADDAAFADRVERLVISVSVGKHDVDDARLQDHELCASLSDSKYVLRRLKELLPGSVEQLSQDVLVCIMKEFNVALAQFHEFFAFQIVWIVYYLVYDELLQIDEVRKKFVERLLVNHTDGAIRH